MPRDLAWLLTQGAHRQAQIGAQGLTLLLSSSMKDKLVQDPRFRRQENEREGEEIPG